MTRLAACAFALALWAPVHIGQQNVYDQILNDKRVSDLLQYHRMLDAYRRGDVTNSVDAVLQWTHARLTNALAAADGLKDPRSPWDRRRYGLAAMLHTDAALRLSPTCETSDSNWQLKLASQLLAMGTSKHSKEVSPLAEDWYLATSRYVRDHLAATAAEWLLELGRKRLPGNAVVLYESGTLAELFATDYALAGMITESPQHGAQVSLRVVLARRGGYLDQAETWLRASLRADPSNALGELHLGRVLALERKDAGSLATLGSVLSTSGAGTVRYLAHLFIGGVRQRQGDLEAAAVAYRAAIGAHPRCHAARVGLSEVLRHAGHGDDARAVVESLVREAAGPTEEPLWLYQFEPSGAADARLDRLRKDVRQ